MAPKYTVENLADFFYAVLSPDAKIYAVPLRAVAENRAEVLVSFGEYADIETALREEVVPMLNEDDFDLADHIKNNTNFSDFEQVATYLGRLEASTDLRQEAWVSGKYAILPKSGKVDEYFSLRDLD